VIPYFLIGAGSVRVILVGAKAQEVALSALGAGELFGEMAVVEHKPRAATVIAEEDCVLLEIKGREFSKLLTRHADVEFKVLLELSERLRSLNQSLTVQVKGVDEKLEIFHTELRAELKVVEASINYPAASYGVSNGKTLPGCEASFGESHPARD
jgi:CRP-like cAMP-binding protein